MLVDGSEERRGTGRGCCNTFIMSVSIGNDAGTREVTNRCWGGTLYVWLPYSVGRLY